MIWYDQFREMLTGKLRLFRYSMDQLERLYGVEYQEDAEFLIDAIGAVAESNSDDLRLLVDDYFRYVAELVNAYQAYEVGRGYRLWELAPATEPWGADGYDRRYLYTLALSLFLSRNRYETYRHYRAALRRYITPAADQELLEIGGGTCIDAAFASQFGSVHVYETNASAGDWLSVLRPSGVVHLTVDEYAFADVERYSLVSLVELLEHVADPSSLLRLAVGTLKHDGLAYLTFALRMPQHDHLFEFVSVDQCRALVASAGLAVLSEFGTVSTYRSFNEAERWALVDHGDDPATYCCVAARQFEGHGVST